MTKHVLIIAGGTGGHVFPALAVAEELTSRNVQVSWMGTERGIESKLVPEAGYPIHYIKVQGLRGNGTLGWLLAAFKLIKAVFEALQVIKHIKPDVILGLGGFASGPGAVAGKLLRKPLVIHEQNSIPGMTNQLLARIADRVMEGFANSFVESREAVWLGNPVRKSVEALPSPAARFQDRGDQLRLLVLGGSLGARALNTTIPQALALINEAQRPQVKHQCGQHHINDCKQNYQSAQVDADVTAFIHDMAAAYAWSDLVICRAGALTVAEIAAAGVGALFVPYPYAVDDHQTKNATILAEQGAAKIIAEHYLNAKSLANEIMQLAQQREQLLTMATAARGQAKLGTAKQISDICMELAHG